MSERLTEMDYVRGAIGYALAQGLTINDLYTCAFKANSPSDFDLLVGFLVHIRKEEE